jgi:hypothetical protein
VSAALCTVAGLAARPGSGEASTAWPSPQLVGLRVALTFSAEESSSQCPSEVGAFPTMTTISASLNGQSSLGGWSFVPWDTPGRSSPSGEIFFPSQAYSGQMDHVTGFSMYVNVAGPGYQPGQLQLNVRGGGTSLCPGGAPITTPLATEPSPLGAAYPIKWGLSDGGSAYGGGCGYVALTGAPYDYYHPTPFTETLLLTDTTTAASIVGRGQAGFDCVAGHAVVKTPMTTPTKAKPAPTSTKPVPKCPKTHPKSTKAHPCRKG